MTVGAMLQVRRAFDRQVVAEIAVDDAGSIETKLAGAARLFRDRSAWLAPHQRIAILRRLAASMGDARQELTSLIVEEGGKPLRDARVEVDRAIDGVSNAAEQLRSIGGREVPMGITPASDGRWAFTIREPIGPVVAISAFNHPLNLIVHQAVPALAVGCPVIVKPASATPRTCLALLRLIGEAGLPEPWCQSVVTDDNGLAERLATDPRVALMSFIGSARVGWSLHHKLAPGTRALLEHGGAAPVIVDRSASLDGVVEALAKGGYYHAGQVCVSTQRIFVHADIADAFLDRFTARVAALRVGDPADEATEIGPLIRPQEADRVQDWVKEAVEGGARMLTGGRRHSATVLAPVVLDEPGVDARVSREEIFGPVTCVYRYRQIDDAIARANALPVAFQASIFSQDIGPALQAAEQLDASAVMINDHTAFRTDWMPFGGRRASGLGVGGIPASMHEMTQDKMLVWRRAG